MKKLALISVVTVMAILSLNNGYAASSAISKNSPTINAMAEAWKAKKVIGNQANQTNSHTIYGGSDLSPRTTLISPSATV